MAIQTGDAVKFEYVNGSSLPANPDESTVYFVSQAQPPAIYIGSTKFCDYQGAISSAVGGITKESLGLGNVDNTADADKSVNSANTLTTARNVDGVSFNGSANIHHYAACDTAAATVAKVATISGNQFTLSVGSVVFVKFKYANTATNPTLNVNSTGAKAIKRYGTTAPSTSATGSWNANSVMCLIYDGTYWQIVGWLNTPYSGMTEAEVTAGTSTTTRLITPARLKFAIETWADKNVQSDWNQTDSSADDYIKNKPTIPSSVPTKISDLTNDQVYDLGSLGDLTNNMLTFTPTSQQIADVVAMWNRGLCAVRFMVDEIEFYALKEHIVRFNGIDFYAFVSTEAHASGQIVQTGTIMLGISQTAGVGMVGYVPDINTEDVDMRISSVGGSTFLNQQLTINGTSWDNSTNSYTVAVPDSISDLTDDSNFITGGTVSQPTFTGTQATITSNFTPSGSITVTTADNASGNYQPKGSVTVGTSSSTHNVTGSAASGANVTYTPAGSVTVGTSSAAHPVSTTSGEVTYTPAGSVSLTTSGKTTTVSKASTGSTTYTPEGTVSQPTFSGTAKSISLSGNFTPQGNITVGTSTQTYTVSKASSGTATYTPEGGVSFTNGSKSVTLSRTAGSSADNTFQSSGSVSKPTITLKTAGSTADVYSITAVGTLPTLSFTPDADTETCVISWNPGTLPTKGSKQTVKTGDGAYESSTPTFTGDYHKLRGSVSVPTSASFSGTGARLVTSSVTIPSGSGTFVGTEGSVSVSGSYTPEGTVSKPTFSGTGARLVTGSITTADSASFTGTGVRLATDSIVSPTGSGTFSGTGVKLATDSIVSPTGSGTFTGTKAQISASFSGTAGQATATYTPEGTVSKPTFTGTK